jgi:TPR repeat protein
MEQDKFIELRDRALSGDIKSKKDFAYLCLEVNRTATAYDFFMQAAKDEDPEAEYMLGVIYNKGLGKQKNEEQALCWFQKAAKRGYSSAELELKKLLNSLGQAADFELPGNDNIEAAEKDNTHQPSEESDKKSCPVSFSDLVYKKDENGNNMVTVVDNPSYTNTDNSEQRSNGKYNADQYDIGYYRDIPVKITHPDYSRNPIEALQKLIGLKNAKSQIELIQKRVNFEIKRKNANLNNLPSSHHFVFRGNPGTGKTELARLLGHLLHDAGLLKKGHVVEVDRSDLVAGWIGHSALKTEAVIEQALGGVLLIDEAYSLTSGYDYDFGDEVIATLLKHMEDSKTDFVTVVAGYKEEMDLFVRSNPGLKSRFRHYIDFDDFSAEELLQIFKKYCHEYDYVLAKDAQEALSKTLDNLEKQGKFTKGNARFIRNIFELVIEKMAVRVVNQNSDDFRTIQLFDIPYAAQCSSYI